MKIIKWFTHNFDKEVGALGIGELRDGELIVERLVFPTQIVNGAHVHFKPEDWGPIITELSDEEISKICFYWHKHPGSASASQGDEEDTFDVFMDPSSERPFFGFMQTGTKFNNQFDYEARIELRDPVCCSITDVEIVTDENDEIEELCQKIIEDKITTGNASASDQPGMKANKQELAKPVTPNKKSVKMSKKTIFEVKNSNGKLILEMSPYFVNGISEMLDGELFSQYVRTYSADIKNTDASIITVFPQKKCIKKLYKKFKSIRDEMFLSTDLVQDTLETALNSQDVYDEDKDIAESQSKYEEDNAYYGNGTDWRDNDYYTSRGY